jgi:P-type Ca2+ transporter type 2C
MERSAQQTVPRPNSGITAWWSSPIEKTAQALEVDLEKGLAASEAKRRQATYGVNELTEKGSRSPWRILWEQLSATLVIVLIIAAAVSGVMGDYKNAAVILAIVILNTLLGFSQEYRAEKALEALKKMAVPHVRVRRDGQVQEISATNLVPGDIVLLEAGNLLPADARLIESASLRVQEAALTGESVPVEKSVEALSGPDLPLGDRRNMVYKGTMVIFGRGEAVITGTGMNTELGRIATMIQDVKPQSTLLQKRLDQLGKTLAMVALAVVAFIFVEGLLTGENLRVMFMTAVSMAVAAVPEGLPAVVTIAMALGAQRMLKRRALIRQLSAVETLGSVTVICSDKTGTLTENRMTVTVLRVAGHQVELAAQSPSNVSDQPAVSLLLAGATLCNDAVLQSAEEGSSNKPQALGDPTETAIVVAASKLGLHKAEMEQLFERVAEVPFDSDRKRMTTVHRRLASGAQVPAALKSAREMVHAIGESPYLAFTKGSVEGLTHISASAWVDGKVEPLTEALRKRITDADNQLAQNGVRVLGLGFRPLQSIENGNTAVDLEHDLIFLGLVGMIDPPRTEAKEAVERCKTAGIRPVMITGDHPLTARRIAADLGFLSGDKVLTGPELVRMSIEELRDQVETVSVYARVSPEHKLKIIQALQDRGHIVAMTGDGVNDAPALKKADIGVAMGITGTDVAKGAADMVLLDDNFATIVAAVEEGRVTYDNIRRFVKFIVTTNAAELLVVLVPPLLGMPLPLTPSQILWINLVTDGPTSLTLSVEPAEQGTMQRPPYNKNEGIFDRRTLIDIVWVGLLMSAVSVGIGAWCWRHGHAHWQTMVFSTLTFSQMGNVLAIRSSRDSLFTIGVLSNKPLLVAVVVTLLLQLAVIYVPFLQNFFSTVPLSAKELLLAVTLGSLVFWAVELKKWIIRRQH